MTTALDVLLLARRVWEHSQPQLFIEVDDLTSSPSATIGKPGGTASPAYPILPRMEREGRAEGETPSNDGGGRKQPGAGERGHRQEGL